LNVLKTLRTRHRLCQWHLLKNIMKNLIGKLGNMWQTFIEHLGTLDPNNFLV
jgi:hypothetical protein